LSLALSADHCIACYLVTGKRSEKYKNLRDENQLADSGRIQRSNKFIRESPLAVRDKLIYRSMYWRSAMQGLIASCKRRHGDTNGIVQHAHFDPGSDGVGEHALGERQLRSAVKTAQPRDEPEMSGARRRFVRGSLECHGAQETISDEIYAVAVRVLMVCDLEELESLKLRKHFDQVAFCYAYLGDEQLSEVAVKLGVFAQAEELPVRPFHREFRELVAR
jgi:hypothetical protein